MKNYKNLFATLITFIAGGLFMLLTTSVLGHGGDTSLIHSCVKNSNGSVRIVGPSDTCSSSETATDWSKGSPFSTYPVCPGCDLRNKVLTGIDLTHAYFPEANLSGLNLTGATITNGHLENTDLSNSNLSNANISNANLSGSNLTGANLTGITATGTSLSGDIIINANFTGANLNNADLSGNGPSTGVIFTNTILTNVNFAGRDFTGANFSGDNLSGTQMQSHVNFTNTNMSNVNFSGAGIGDSLFTNANLQGVEWNLADFGSSATDFTDANLSGGHDFGTTTLRSVINWSNTTCPDGTNSNNDGNTCEGHF